MRLSTISLMLFIVLWVGTIIIRLTTTFLPMASTGDSYSFYQYALAMIHSGTFRLVMGITSGIITFVLMIRWGQHLDRTTPHKGSIK